MSSSALRTRRHYRRKRRLSLAEGDARLSRVHSISPGASGIVTGDLFTLTEREAPVTFGMDILLDSNSARGLMLEFGDVDIGLGVWIERNGVLGFSAGRRTRFEDINDRPWAFQETDELTVPVGVPVHVVASCRPGDGTIRAWVNGREEINFRCADGVFGEIPPRWANEGSGQYFGTPNTSARHIGVTVVANSFLSALSDLSVYHDQRPRHYNTGPQGNVGGGGPI